MRFRSLLLLGTLALGFQAMRAEVRVWQGTLTLPTYEEGTPDRNPPFDQYSNTQFNYPYTLRDELSDKKADHEWRAVYLENEYLKCSVLPDIGGHVYTCTDKISGQPMFYANPSIKKALIGYRGAWAAFGVEFNFPVSHNWVSMSPVPYSFGKDADGSAWVLVGNIDRNYGMEWNVRLVLRPGSTVLEEHVTLNNRSDVRHRFYWWNNAGVEVTDESRVQYPMRFSAAHGYADVDTWPVTMTGHDISIIGNQTDGPVSRFVHGSREPYMGVWRPDTHTGTVHYADFTALPAKKIWCFGADADGMDWRKALSDNNSAYVEIQAGLFRNQETYAFLEPRQTIQFAEYWMPMRDIGGIARANLNAVVNLTRNKGSLTVGMNVNRAYPGATISILNGKHVIVFEAKADLTPEHTWTKSVTVPTEPLTFEVRDAKDSVILRQTEGKYDWTPANEIQTGPQQGWKEPRPDMRSEDDWAQIARDYELNGKLLVAMDTYTTALAKYPESVVLHKATGRLAAQLLRYDEAVKHLTPVQARATWDPEIAYYLGIAYDGLGEFDKARTPYEAALRMPEFRSAGTLKLAELLARNGLNEDALELLRGINGDVRVAEETVALENAAGHTAEAQTLAKRTLELQPSLFLQYEMAPEDTTVVHFLAADPDRLLNIAAQYMRLGLYKRALDLLARTYPAVPADQSEPGAVLPQNHPLVAYYRAYCRAKLGEQPAADYAAAAKMSTLYIFPNGAETLQVLKTAVTQNPQDATAQYLLGTQSFSLGLTAPALEAWEKARHLNPALPVLHADMGRAYLNIAHDPEHALSAFQQGLTADPSNTAIYFGVDQALSMLARPAADRVKAIEHYPDLAAMPADLVYELALNRSEAKDYAGAETLFHNRFFPRREGGTNVRGVWTEIRMQEAENLASTGKCEAAMGIVQQIGKAQEGLDFTKDGLEPFVESARTQYMIGKIMVVCGKRDEASQHFKQAIKDDSRSSLIWAQRAAKELPGYDASAWRQKLEAASEAAEKDIDAGSQRGQTFYAAGSLLAELGKAEQSRTRFTQGFQLPDHQFSWHLSRVVMDENKTK